MAEPFQLSKSSFLIGRQCERRLWLRSRGIDEPDSEAAREDGFRDEQARAVEELAETTFARLQRLEGRDLEAAAAQTAHADGTPLAQARVRCGDLVVVPDILEPRLDGWFVWEVKASTIDPGLEKPKTKAIHEWDLAFQWHVLASAALPVVGCGVILLDKRYVRGSGAVDATALLYRFDVTAGARSRLPNVRAELSAMRAVVGGQHEPVAWVRSRCNASRDGTGGDRPSTCGHRLPTGRCGVRLPADWAGYIPNLRGKKQEWVEAEPNRAMADVDLDDGALDWKGQQRIVVEATRRGTPWIDANALREKLDEIEWPVAYLDFEFDTQVAIPRWPGYRPYDRIPFQWAMRIQRRHDTPLESELSFLHESDTDPRRPFAQSLLGALPQTGSIVVHHEAAEREVVQRLASALGGELGERLQALKPRLRDTEEIARVGYYHPQQLGSWSLKKLAPALVGRGYDDLAVADGMAAVRAWRRMSSAGTNETGKASLRSELLAYCGRDAALMHDILEELRHLAGWSP